MNRRSFLASIVGAVAAEAFPKDRNVQAELLTRFDELWEETKALCSQQHFRHFLVSESVKLTGAENRVELVLPPLPPEMILTRLGFRPDMRAPNAGVREAFQVFQDWKIRLAHRQIDAISAPIFLLAPDFQFYPSLTVRAADQFSATLEGERFETPAPVGIQIYFEGLVLL